VGNTMITVRESTKYQFTFRLGRNFKPLGWTATDCTTSAYTEAQARLQMQRKVNKALRRTPGAFVEMVLTASTAKLPQQVGHQTRLF
jgi:hypothetical protein